MSLILCGTWKMSYCQSFDVDGNELENPFNGGTGIISYGEDGMMATQIMKKSYEKSIVGNKKHASLSDYKTAFESYIAYFGSYNINKEDNTVNHLVQGSLWPNLIGLTLARRFEFKDSGNTIVLSTLEAEPYIEDKKIIQSFAWTKVR